MIEMARGRRVAHLGHVDQGCPGKQDSDDAWLHERLCEVAAEVVGFDVAGDAVEALSLRGYPGYTVDCTDPDAVRALNAGTYDLVLLGEIIEHVDNPVGLLRAAKILCAEQGRIVITTPNALSLGVSVAAARRRECVHPDHLMMFSPRTLVATALRAGLEPDRILTYRKETADVYKDKPGISSYTLRDWAVAASSVTADLIARPFAYLQPGLILVCKSGPN